ncbi:hypothetical protein E2C06_35620 [Dankookia rubra]|uniref:Uncharacterized protein n=1 Tax=Dankookia rubra TaxID=1442381 RepID=A0A4R5Q5R5_9PROT|nr:hypothetical protein [Dankookia rubra]TDH57869.1 hypothetical protein E2C06_35620 [Dankookia rubra]
MQHPVLLHIKEHTWLWVAGLVALAALAVVLNQSTPAALIFMVVGILVILKGQGTDLLTIVTDDPLSPEEDELNLAAKPATPRGDAR